MQPVYIFYNVLYNDMMYYYNGVKDEFKVMITPKASLYLSGFAEDSNKVVFITTATSTDSFGF